MDPSTDPFLAARSRRWIAASEAVRWVPERATGTWGWQEPVLLAHTVDRGPTPVVFGRSTATLAERSEADQPIATTEARAASLWHVAGQGFVVAFERLVANTDDLAAQTDALGAMLREAPRHGDGQPSVGDLIQHLWGERPASLRSLFGERAKALEALADAHGAGPALVDRDIVELMVPRRTSISGIRQIEGLVTGISASTQGMGIRDLLERATAGEGLGADELDSRQGTFQWAYREVEVAAERARETAMCAMRSDGRVAVLDLDAFSIYHDYLGWGGDGIVLELVPMAATMGRQARDFWAVADEIANFGCTEPSPAATTGSSDKRRPQPGATDPATGSLPESRRDLGRRLRLVRGVRARTQLRQLLGDQLLNDSNFKSWTNPSHLRRELAPTALQDAMAPAPGRTQVDDNVAASIEVLEQLLQLTLDDQRTVVAERQERTRALLQAALGVVTGAGLLGLFAALASMPRAGRAIPTLTSAGLWTLLAATALGLLVAGGWALLHARPPARTLPSWALVLAGVVAGALTAAGLALSEPFDTLCLSMALLLVFSIVAVVLRGLAPATSAAHHERLVIEPVA